MRDLMLQGIVFSLLIGLFVVGCEYTEVGQPPEPITGFVAEQTDFADYRNWQTNDYTVAPNAILGSAHMGNNPDYARRVYINSGETVGDEYLSGTILIKETFTWEDDNPKFAEIGGILAMAKRGGDFNPNGGGWEWFMLAPDLSIAARGGEEMMDGMCNGCHAAAQGAGGTDSVFPHPVEYEATEADFADYQTWSVTGEASEPHEVLGPAHKGEDGLRRVYKKQLLANPDTEAQGYPTGTIVLKETEVDDAVTEITAMVKRGGDFNPEHSAWEWFMLNPANLSIMGRGADLGDGMCNGCHASAKEPKYGKDYVFKHPDDPFNN
ncbi:cytochrome P460 family protein [bacterium]|nr:cytochrome P460 family protein [bacterium]